MLIPILLFIFYRFNTPLLVVVPVYINEIFGEVLSKGAYLHREKRGVERVVNILRLVLKVRLLLMQ